MTLDILLPILMLMATIYGAANFIVAVISMVNAVIKSIFKLLKYLFR